MVTKIIIYNRNDCPLSAEPTGCRGRLSNSNVTLYDAGSNFIASYRIGDASKLDRIVISNDKQLAKSVMHSCDRSMSLLVGSTTSVGTLQAIANAVVDNGPQHMPGECCMDVATNSDFFGYRVSG